ncbi:MAG: hypothetical protein AB2L24_21820 [Mangrovibacterium sp.]
MNFAEKKQAYQDLQGSGHLEVDRELLRRKAPHAHALNTGILDPVKAQREILWALLDVTTIDEIKANRKPAEQPANPEPEPKKDLTIADAEKKLIELDLATASQKEMARLARILKAEVNNYKAETLRKYLEDYRLNIEKEDPGGGPKKEEVPADLDKINELKVENENLKSELEDKEAENDDLKSELEDKELENEDLQDQVDELEEQLEEEKKSPAPQDPDQK